MAESGRKGMVVAVAALVVIVCTGAWIGKSLFYEPPAPPPLDHQWVCDKCGHVFHQPLPQLGEPKEGEPMNLADLLGSPTKCPKCGADAHCRPLLRCRRCGVAFAATIVLGDEGKPIPFQCINPDCERPLLSGNILTPETEAKARKFKCDSCGRTFLLVDTAKAQAEDLICPYCDQGSARVRPVE